MIRKLRIKFICVIMAIVMVLLGCILSVVIHFTGQSMEMQSISMMRTIATSPFQQGIPGKPRDDQVRLPFFTVQISSRGELIAASGGYFDLTDREYLQEIVNSALRSDREIGELEEHDLRFLKSVSPRGFTIVFSDTTTESSTLKHLFYSCMAIFFVAMIVFLGISILLSHWAIKPVATAWDQQRQFVADASHELKTPPVRNHGKCRADAGSGYRRGRPGNLFRQYPKYDLSDAHTGGKYAGDGPGGQRHGEDEFCIR